MLIVGILARFSFFVKEKWGLTSGKKGFIIEKGTCENNEPFFREAGVVKTAVRCFFIPS